MRGRLFVILIISSLVCAAASGGVAYAYATSVVPGLDRTDPVTAVTAMAGIITESRLNPAFALLLIATAVLALVVGVLAARQLRQPGCGYLLAGAVFALIAGIVTLLFNVPLNTRLNALDPAVLTPADAAREWQAYAEPWLLWNAVRCVAALAGAVLFAVGLWRLAGRRESATVG
ncbi:MAG: DUF1772 domain-containing protein [Mycobacterium sp.]